MISAKKAEDITQHLLWRNKEIHSRTFWAIRAIEVSILNAIANQFSDCICYYIKDAEYLFLKNYGYKIEAEQDEDGITFHVISW